MAGLWASLSHVFVGQGSMIVPQIPQRFLISKALSHNWHIQRENEFWAPVETSKVFTKVLLFSL